MTDRFDNIRAERETPYRSAVTSSSRYAGLWKQVAIGIVVGNLSLGLIGAVGWMAADQLLIGGLQIAAPWAEHKR